MPLLFAGLANFLSVAIFQFFSFFARMATWNVAILTITTVALGVALVALLNELGNYANTLVTQAASIPAIPYFLPSNFAYCLGAYTSVRVASTVYVWTVNFINRKAFILKA